MTNTQTTRRGAIRRIRKLMYRIRSAKTAEKMIHGLIQTYADSPGYLDLLHDVFVPSEGFTDRCKWHWIYRRDFC